MITGKLYRRHGRSFEEALADSQKNLQTHRPVLDFKTPETYAPPDCRHGDYTAIGDNGAGFMDGWIIVKRKEIIGRVVKEHTFDDEEHDYAYVFRPIAGLEDHWQECKSEADFYEANGTGLYPVALKIILETLDKQEAEGAK